jgi:hypothetical protein
MATALDNKRSQRSTRIAACLEQASGVGEYSHVYVFPPRDFHQVKRQSED